jgi:outer membrane protein OmpA-like peptidoglycan-associated protein
MRSVLWRFLVPALTALLAGAAAAQSISIDPNLHMPAFGFPTNRDDKPDSYKRLPYRDLASEIRIEVAASALYDFDSGKVPPSAADYMQQAANLIFEHAAGPVRIECRSDRTPASYAQKLAEKCAGVIAQWLTVEEKLTHTKFTTVGSSIAPPASANSNDPFARADAGKTNVTIVFAKK